MRRTIFTLEQLREHYGRLLVNHGDKVAPIFTGPLPDQIINLMTVHERLKRLHSAENQHIFKALTPFRNQAVHEWTLLIKPPCHNHNRWLKDLHERELMK